MSLPEDETPAGSRRLAVAQKEAILAWIGEGFSDQEIWKKINAERDAGVDHHGSFWPPLSRQAVAYYRARWGDRFADLQANAFELAAGTGLAKRQVLVRRAARRAGQIDLFIDRLEDEAESLIQQSVLATLKLEDAEADPDIVETSWTVDGESRAPVPAVRGNRSRMRLYADPRYDRLKDLLATLLPAQRADHIKYLQLIAKLGGLGGKQAADDEPPITPLQRRSRAEGLLEEIEELLAGRVTVPR